MRKNAKTRQSHGKNFFLRNIELRDLVRKVVDASDPIEIILFGSRARGSARPDSDYDLMVVVRNGSHRHHIRQKLYRALYGSDIDFDLLVSTPEDLRKYGGHPSLVYKYVLRDGVCLYAA